MCGLIYGHSFLGKPVNNQILDQYDKQKHRGQQGFGVFNGKFMVHAAEENRILNWLCKEKNNSELLLMHHRFPTSTINVRKAAHPFTTGRYFGKTQYILVHNGSIRNDDELYKEHYKHGIRYQSLLQDLTFNDSEALLWDFARFMEGKQKKMQAYGAIAFVCIKLEDGKLDKLYFGRNTNPLNMKRDKEGISLSSEGEGEPIDSDQLYTYNYELNRLTKRPLVLDTYDKSYVYTGRNYGQHYPRSDAWDNDYDEWQSESDGYYDIDGRWHPYGGSVSTYQPPKPAKRAGDWLSPELRRKFGIWLAEGQNDQTKLLSSQTEVREDVRNTVFGYLTDAEGHFEEAYWALELDYQNLLDDDQSQVADVVLLEEAMEYITRDPEYINEKSVSSYWSTSWQKQNK